MKGRIAWFSANVLMAALLLASCGPKSPTASVPSPTPTSAPTPVPAPVSAPAPKSTPTAAAEKPKYGGTFTIITPTLLEVFSPAALPRSVQLSGYVYEQFTNNNWAMGPAGTGETSYENGITKWGDITGWLAESFETPEIGVWKLNIRKGVRFGLDPKSEASRLANGREMTADDALWNVQYLKDTSTSWLNLAQPGLAKSYTVEKTGPWQITVRTPVDPGIGYCWIMGGGGSQFIWPREVVEKYAKSNDWQQAVGTGPYMLTDFIPGSVATFIRNPNYWLKNPVGPGKGDQLPYPDGLKYLMVVDLSTRLAAMRTGRADWVDAIEGEDARSLIKTNPKLQSMKFLPTAMRFAMRLDKPDLPYKDVRVRQALMLATDFEAMKKDLYGGEAEIFTVPMASWVKNIYIPLEQLPESAKALYKYNPERAKQLLAAAGYPGGFKAKVIVLNTSSAMDPAAVFKAMWAKVGVDLEIQPRDASVYAAINAARSQEEMAFRTAVDMTGLSTRYVFGGWRGATSNNPSYINDPPGKDTVIEAAFQEIQKNVIINFPKADQIVHDLIPYVVEQAYYIPQPAPYSYRLWQPWIKNYHGESGDKIWLPYVWIDQDLKETITGRR